MKNNSFVRTDEVFTQAYDQHVNRVYQLCYLYLKNPQDAEDAVQSVFLKYLTSGKQFNNLEHEKAWFITVAKNHCRDFLRLHWNKKRTDMDKLPESYEKTDNDYSDLLESLMTLPAKYKDVLYLYYMEGYSIKEISKILRKNQSTLRNHLSKGRNLLKIDLGGYYEK